MSRPNLLLVMCDQLRFDALGSTGGPGATPQIDALARDGATFTTCVAASPQCVPARIAFATGRYPHQSGVWQNQDIDLAPGTPTWMGALRSAGYRTALIGKSHLHRHDGDLRDREPLMHAIGFDHVDEIPGPTACMTVGSHMTELWRREGWLDRYRADLQDRFERHPWIARPSVLPLALYADVYVGTRSARWLADLPAGSPWFLTVGFSGPHDPWDAPEPYASRYDPAAMPAPRPAPVDAAPRPPGEFDEHAAAQRRRLALAPHDIAALRANYAGKVALIDDEVGRVVEAVRMRGELDRTVIVFTSDHGEMNGDAGLLYKSTFLDGAALVPLVVRAPGVRARSARIAAPVESFDIAATLADFGGAALPPRFRCRSLRPMLDDAGARTRDEALCEFKREVMMVEDRWKLALNVRGEPYQLFDRRGDPLEAVNLAGDPAHGEVAASLAMRIVGRLKDSMRRPRAAAGGDA